MREAGLTAFAKWWGEFTYGPWPPDAALITAVYTEMERARLGGVGQAPLEKCLDCL